MLARLRRVVVVGLLIAAVGAVPAAAAGQFTISPNNPYRSFNISGINYGSMQWERQHRGTSYSRSSYSQSRRGVGTYQRRWRRW